MAHGIMNSEQFEHGLAGTVDEGLLVRRLHGEIDPAEALALNEHLAVCEACRNAAEALEATARQVGDALQAGDWAQPSPEEWARVLRTVRARANRPRATRGWIAAGIVLALAAGASMASASVRGWVVGRWERWTSGDAPSTASAPESREDGRADLEFLPGGATVEITFDTAPLSGTLLVSFGDGDRATVSVSGGGEERFAVGERGVTVGNVAASRASWEVVLPVGVERVSVHVGKLDSVELTRADQATNPIVVDLARAAVRTPGVRDEH